MKHRRRHRLIKFSTVLLCMAILLLPFSAQPLLARSDKPAPKLTLTFSTDIDSNHRPQTVAQAMPTRPNRSINIYLFLPVITAPPTQTQAASTHAAQSPTTNANTPQSLNIYIFLPVIAR